MQMTEPAANGNYDFEFWLFDAAAAGSQVGSTASRNYNATGEVDDFKYDRIGVVLVNAVKEQQAQIERQQQQIEEQTELLRSQIALVKALRSIVCDPEKTAKVCQENVNEIHNYFQSFSSFIFVDAAIDIGADK
jgi:hypothetical protein